jgi:ubiquinone/menaquinone biosynthesis C-methylase UbiE
VERTRIFCKFLTDSNFFDSNKTVLHVAPELKLFYRFSLNPLIDYHPIDKFTEGYTRPKGTINMDITDMKYPDNLFDFILCSHVLEHVPNDILAISELFRVMKYGGWGILQVPIEMDREKTYEDESITSPEERKKAFGQFDHVRMYGKDYIDKLQSAGFEVELNDYAQKVSEVDKMRYGFGIEENIFIVKKSLTKPKLH